jgi:hypothetical protein
MHCRCSIQKPAFRLGWLQQQPQQQQQSAISAEEAMYEFHMLSPDRNGSLGALARSVPGLWQGWQRALLRAFVQLHKLLAQLSSSAPQTATAGSSSIDGSLEAGSNSNCSSSSSSSSSSGSKMQVKWGYLLELLCSSNWTQTVAAFNSRWPDMPAVFDRHRQAQQAGCYASVSRQQQQQQQHGKRCQRTQFTARGSGRYQPVVQ